MEISLLKLKVWRVKSDKHTIREGCKVVMKGLENGKCTD